MIGDIVVVEGVEFEVVWDGGEGLVPDRITKNLNFWTAPPRLYNKKSDYWKRFDKPETGTPNSQPQEKLA